MCSSSCRLSHSLHCLKVLKLIKGVKCDGFLFDKRTAGVLFGKTLHVATEQGQGKGVSVLRCKKMQQSSANTTSEAKKVFQTNASTRVKTF